MVKHTQTIVGNQTVRRKKPTNYLSVFDHFVKLALKGLVSDVDIDAWRLLLSFVEYDAKRTP